MRSIESLDWPVLVCDDSSLNQNIFQRFLKQVGISNVSLADEGASALQWLLQYAKTSAKSKRHIRRPFVILDMSMPVLDGLKTAELWRDIEKSLNIPRACIVLVSAMSDDVASPHLDHYLKKPLLLSDLSAVFAKFRSNNPQ